MNDRIKTLKLMHETMQCMNNEEAYYSWIYTMPDCPTEDDFEFIAGDDENYDDTIRTFTRIFNNYSKSGLYQAPPEVFTFAQQYNPNIKNID